MVADDMSGALELWASIPNELAARLRPMSGVLIRDVIREIQKEIPAYNQLLEGRFRDVLIGAVDMAVVKCFRNIGSPKAEQADWQAMFRDIGKAEFLAGRTMDDLQSAIRVGARVGWRHVNLTGRRIGIPADVLFTVTDAIFAWVDELSTVAVEGYAEARAHATGTIDRSRKRLLKLILAEPPASRQSIVDLAETAGWLLPEQVAVVALEYVDDQLRRPAITLDPEVLVDLDSSTPCLIVADPRERLVGLGAELCGRRAAVGPVVRLGDASRSLAVARRTLALVRRGVLPDNPVTWAEDHLSTLAVLADEFLIAQLITHALRPLAELRVSQGDRLAATLHAWLRTRGRSISEVAQRLNIHSQTVRYRMHQIEELFGSRLSDPKERLNIEVALRARELLNPPRERADESS